MKRLLMFGCAACGAMALVGCGSPTAPARPTSISSTIASPTTFGSALSVAGPITAQSMPWQCIATASASLRPSGCPAIEQSLRVAAVNAAAAASGPYLFAPTVSGSTVMLSWVQAPTAVAYYVQAGSASGLSDVANTNIGWTGVLTATNVPAGTYFVRIVAVDAAGSRGVSNEVVVNVTSGGGPAPCASVPNAPSGLRLTSSSGGTAIFDWTAPTGSPTSYRVEAGSSPGLHDLADQDLASAFPGLRAIGVGDGTYYVRVRATNSCGISAASNEVVLVVGAAAPPACAPNAPSGLTATVSGTTTTFRWTAAAAGAAATSYVLEAGTTAGLANIAIADVGGATTFVAANVAPGTYFVRVKAKNACGSSGPTNEISVTVASPAPVPVPIACVITTSVFTDINTDANAGSFPVTVTDTPGCNWIATSNASWLVVPSTAASVGTRTFVFTVDANPGAARQGKITIVGLNTAAVTITVNQAAATPTSTPKTPTITATPSSVSVTCMPYPSYCSASQNITITSSTPWTASNQAIYFDVSPDFGSAGSTIVAISYKSSQFNVPLKGSIYFSTTNTGVFVEVPVVLIVR